nr:Chain A, Possible protein of nuclear scaffold [Encephalitozoon cuniculi]3KAE_B Chain B, Possible protein of nuclear scaffold [Encephalitozoon cuniculi]3KAE_C Chain C, Possible protein of nuclear scaffold [Encephalitozoon cuniculi]3KAE_D Chain D, Possible protein of nuclear scaffold [Encephalitozoon cuniculi]
MDSKLIGKICKSIRYRDYETAIFLAACLLPCKPEYRMLMSIVLYLNGEYTRALFHLHKLNTCTSKYYESLCYKKKKDYKKAIKSLESILEGKVERDPDVDARIQEMFVDPGDEEFFESLLGDLCTLSGYREEGIGHYVRSFGKSFLFSPVENLLLENKVPQKRDKENVRQTGRRGIEEEYVSDSIEFHESLSPSLVKKYMEHVPGIGSYFISNAARRYFNLGMNDKSKACFELVRRKDPMFL